MNIHNECIICGQVYDDHKRPAEEYVKTKRKTIIYFHYSCYIKEKKENDKNKKDI